MDRTAVLRCLEQARRAPTPAEASAVYEAFLLNLLKQTQIAEIRARLNALKDRVLLLATQCDLRTARPRLEKTERQIFERETVPAEEEHLAKTPENTSSGTSYTFSDLLDLPPSMFSFYTNQTYI